MKNIKLLVLLLFLIIPYILFCQENIITSIIEPLQKEALYREKIFIHLNKTIYFTNENIWYTAYVAEDSSNTPSNYTTNLHVNLLNANGDTVDSKNVFIQNGVGYGNFLIDSQYKSGKYYIHGFTNYMRNFGKENVFIQEIDIINPAIKKEITQQQNISNYDIQLFPESGYLLEDTENNLGIKALINGKGYPFTGKIINSKGSEITTFKGNLFGMSSCDFFYRKSETYTAVVNINNTIQKINLPEAKSTGIIFSIANTNTENVNLILKTNKETLPSLKDEILTLLFYRNNFISEAITLSPKNNQQTTQELFFDKSKMLNGVNVVTLFKNNQPVAERKFFLDKSNEQTALLIEELQTVNDSINFKIRTKDSNNKPITSQLSISILPVKSKIFYEQQNIKSAFLLSPYLKGVIENPAYYFKNTNSQEKEFLDLLLLNQGWSTYNLEEKIKELNPKEQFSFENGFTLSGNIKKYPKGYDICLISQKNRLTASSKFNENKEFSFENVFAYKNDSIKIALIKKDKPLLKPDGVDFTKVKPKNENLSSLTNRYNHNIIIEKNLSSSSKKTPSEFNPYFNAVQLDEVILKEVVTKKKETIYDIEMNLANKRNVLAPGFYENKKVTEQMELIHNTVFNYFQNLGFITRTNEGTYFIKLRHAPATFTALARNPDNTFPPTIFIDDTPIRRKQTIPTLEALLMADVDEILINRLGAGGGLEGAGGIIKIYLKKGNHEYFEEEPQKLYQSLILLTGFDKAKNISDLSIIWIQKICLIGPR